MPKHATKKRKKAVVRGNDSSSSDESDFILHTGSSSGESQDESSSPADDVRAGDRRGGGSPQRRARNWLFTWNNPGIEEAQFEEHLRSRPGLTYYVFQRERGEIGTEHYQGYIQFKSEKTLSAVKNQVSPFAHFEIARGTPDQNVTYCTKAETRVRGPYDWGTLKRQGQRTDLALVADRVTAGASIRELAQEFPKQFIQYSSGIYKFKRTVAPPPLVLNRICKLFIGPTRTGKTWSATHDQSSPGVWTEKNSVFLKQPDAWFDGYNGETTLVLDEFGGASQHLPLTMILCWMDNYRNQLPLKGAYEWNYATEIIFTSNLHPRKWYSWKDREESYLALCARFAEVSIWTARGAPTTVLTTKETILDFFNDGVKYGFSTTTINQKDIDPMKR